MTDYDYKLHDAYWLSNTTIVGYYGISTIHLNNVIKVDGKYITNNDDGLILTYFVENWIDPKPNVAETTYDRPSKVDGYLMNGFWQQIGKSGVVWGNIYGDRKNRFMDDTHIHTSEVLEYDGFTIRTRNSKYRVLSWKDGELYKMMESLRKKRESVA